MRGILFVILLFSYIGIEWHLSGRAYQYRVDPERPAWGFDIFFPERFNNAGQTSRRAAVRFLVGGAVLLAVAIVLLSPP